MYRCRYCTYIGPRKDFEIEHKIPVSRSIFASIDPQNIELICSGCNRQKGGKTPQEYILWRIFNPKIKNYGPNPNR